MILHMALVFLFTAGMNATSNGLAKLQEEVCLPLQVSAYTSQAGLDWALKSLSLHYLPNVLRQTIIYVVIIVRCATAMS